MHRTDVAELAAGLLACTVYLVIPVLYLSIMIARAAARWIQIRRQLHDLTRDLNADADELSSPPG